MISHDFVLNFVLEPEVGETPVFEAAASGNVSVT